MAIFSRDSMKAWTIGLNFVFSTFIGLGMGYWLDRVFKTSPWLTLIFLFIGIVAGFLELFRMAKREDNGTDK